VGTWTSVGSHTPTRGSVAGVGRQLKVASHGECLTAGQSSQTLVRVSLCLRTVGHQLVTALAKFFPLSLTVISRLALGARRE
jgi:hypothetical protein